MEDALTAPAVAPEPSSAPPALEPTTVDVSPEPTDAEPMAEPQRRYLDEATNEELAADIDRRGWTHEQFKAAQTHNEVTKRFLNEQHLRQQATWAAVAELENFDRWWKSQAPEVKEYFLTEAPDRGRYAESVRQVADHRQRPQSQAGKPTSPTTWWRIWALVWPRNQSFGISPRKNGQS